MLMQEHPIEFVERVAGLMRIPAVRHRRHRLPATLPGQTLKRPDRRRLRHRLAPRPRPGLRQPAQLRQRRRIQTGPVLMGSVGVGWGRKFHRFLSLTHPAVGGCASRSRPSPSAARDTGRAMSRENVELDATGRRGLGSRRSCGCRRAGGRSPRAGLRIQAALSRPGSTGASGGAREMVGRDGARDGGAGATAPRSRRVGGDLGEYVLVVTSHQRDAGMVAECRSTSGSSASSASRAENGPLGEVPSRPSARPSPPPGRRSRRCRRRTWRSPSALNALALRGEIRCRPRTRRERRSCDEPRRSTRRTPRSSAAARPWSHIGRSTPRCSTTSTARWRSGSTRATG